MRITCRSIGSGFARLETYKRRRRNPCSSSPPSLDLLRSSAKPSTRADDASLLKTMQLCTSYKALKAPIPPCHATGKKCHQRQQEGTTGGWMVLEPAARFAHVATEEDVDMSQHRADSTGSLMAEGRKGSLAVNARRVRKSLPARKNHHQLEPLLPERPIVYQGSPLRRSNHTNMRANLQVAFQACLLILGTPTWWTSAGSTGGWRGRAHKPAHATLCCRLQGTSTLNNSTIIISSCTCASISRKADLPTQQESEKERAAHTTENRTPEAVDDGPGIECPRGQHLFNHFDNKERKTHMVTQVSDR